MCEMIINARVEYQHKFHCKTHPWQTRKFVINCALVQGAISRAACNILAFTY